jgi:hypothetical protein
MDRLELVLTAHDLDPRAATLGQARQCPRDIRDLNAATRRPAQGRITGNPAAWAPAMTR